MKNKFKNIIITAVTVLSIGLIIPPTISIPLLEEPNTESDSEYAPQHDLSEKDVEKK